MSNCKNLVTFMKQSGSVNLLPKILHKEVETRWNSRLIMLMSVHEQIDNIHEILLQKGEGYKLRGIDIQLLTDIILFLKPFKEASDALEQEKL